MVCVCVCVCVCVYVCAAKFVSITLSFLWMASKALCTFTQLQVPKLSQKADEPWLALVTVQWCACYQANWLHWWTIVETAVKAGRQIGEIAARSQPTHYPRALCHHHACTHAYMHTTMRPASLLACLLTAQEFCPEHGLLNPHVIKETTASCATGHPCLAVENHHDHKDRQLGGEMLSPIPQGTQDERKHGDKSIHTPVTWLAGGKVENHSSPISSPGKMSHTHS